MTDGSRLRESWSSALKHAQNNFRSLLTSSASASWKRVTAVARETTTNSPPGKGKGKALPQASDVIVHRRPTKSGDVVRLVLELPAEDGLASLESWRAVLTTPEMRKEWDPTVEAAHVVEMFDPNTRISKTDFTLGWPANPRDAITISRAYTDANTLIDISTSLPRSTDEPGYLRPAPPYVRSQVHLFAWCIQLITSPSESPGKSNVPQLRITCFWQQDFKAMWGAATLTQNLPSMVIGLVRAVRKRGDRIPMVAGWGGGVSLDNVSFTVDRQALRVDYSIIPDDEDHMSTSETVTDLRALKEKRRLERSTELILPISQGWDVQISTRASSEETAKSPWAVYATRVTSSPSPESSLASPTAGSFPETSSSPSSEPAYDHIVFRVAHTKLQGHSILKVKLIVELSGGTSGLRINGVPHTIEDAESRDPSSYTMPKQMLEDATSISGISYQTASTAGSGSSATPSAQAQVTPKKSGERSPAADKTILTLVRRNYIYFTSLLQEPEAKWRHIIEGRGVTISKLDTIDPTLVVYRAEAVFVGVGVWDLYSTIKTPGAKVYWDRGFDDGVLLEDVNELSELWHVSQKAAWPVNARDSVVLTTSYKSPTAIHVFSFSVDDRQLFSSIPTPDIATIRTQVDLHGWAIEALSPTTTLLTLLDQSDPKGWSNKSSIPQQMIATMAGVGEYAIKCGGPPISTRLGGAKFTQMKYDHERGTFKVEYEGSEARRSSASGQESVGFTPTASTTDLIEPTVDTGTVSKINTGLMPKIECELRCDIDTWAAGLEVVIDPPPQSVSCLRRHRLTSGGGLWITIEHDATFVGEEPLLATVRKLVNAKEKGLVLVNGSRIKVDSEELAESEVKALTKQKRVKPVRIPLDQPPVLGVIRRRRAEWDEDSETEPSSSANSVRGVEASTKSTSPMFSSPLAKFFTTAYEQTVSTTNAAAAALTPASYATPVGSTPSPPASELPMQGALKALLYLRRLNAEPVDDGWTLASDKGGLSVTKKMEPSISDTIHVHKAEKVIEGISAGEIALAISNYDSRKAWDDRFLSYTELESYGSGCSTGFLVVKSGFPFRDRGFWVSNIACRLNNASPPLQVSRGRRLGSDASLTAPSTVSDSSAIFIVSVSYNPSAAPSRFSSSKVNPAVFPTGQLLISGWILETVDPYQPDQNYAIPSTKCVHVVAVDYRGSVPIAFNSSMNAMLPRTEILGLEAWLKSKGAFNVGPGVRTPGQSLAIGPDDPPATEDSNSREAWTLRKEDDAVLLSSSFDPLSKEFRTKVSLSLSPSETAFSDTEETSPTASPESRSLVEIPARMFTRSFSRSSTMPYGQPNAFRREQSSSDASVASSSTFTPRRFSSTAPRLYTNGSAASPVQRSASRRLSSSTFLPSAEGPTDAGNEGDLIVSELIVNPVLYRARGYRIDISVLSREQGGKGVVDLAALNQLLQEAVDNPLYPFVAQVYTTPASPLLSTTLDKPISRHLVRITLPVRQYYAPTITDPLTGEVRKPPAKPDWLKAVEADGIVVAIKLTEVASAAPPREDAVDCKVWLKGNELKVTSEKTSIMVLGREVLEDEKLWSLAFLSRSAAKEDDEVLPSSLREPVAVNKALLEDPPLNKDPEPSPPTATPADSSLQKDETPTPTPIPPEVVIPDASAVTTQSSQGNGFFNLWNASANFLRIPTLPAVTRPTTPQVLKDEPKQDDTLQSAIETVVTAETTTTPNDVVAGVSLDVLNSPRRYRLSTLIIVAVIAFLCGSLLRSLLSPADFIYFTPESDGSAVAGHTSKDGSSGWREVRRLFEIKYGLVGWDFVVAVVRRPTE